MTGLEPKEDKILEVAALITDWEFNELASYEAAVQYTEDEIQPLIGANPWWETQPEARDDLLKNLGKGRPDNEIQQALLVLINEHFGKEPAVLAGNSIHQDRRFIRAHWPMVDARLHYRMLDVSAWKIVMEGKYGLEYPKKSAHRAMDDIRESIAELKYYLDRGKF
jgi:oligoribonuclease